MGVDGSSSRILFPSSGRRFLEEEAEEEEVVADGSHKSKRRDGGEGGMAFLSKKPKPTSDRFVNRPPAASGCRPTHTSIHDRMDLSIARLPPVAAGLHPPLDSPPRRAVAAVAFAWPRSTPSALPPSRFVAGTRIPSRSGHSGPRPPVAAVCPWSPSPFAVVLLRAGHSRRRLAPPPSRRLRAAASAAGCRRRPSVPWTGGGPLAWSRSTVDRQPWAADSGAPLAGAPLSP
uniref:Uncharacterized protein n=1 Tax=Oryza sativa subsp. japonica TaxID=39947 RepID=Q5Z753_ORYSJ|nr:hypothetical protein [Oryza sativa Japonica Group]